MSITKYEGGQVATLPTAVNAAHHAQDAAVMRLAEWASSADAAYGVAERLSQSAFVPAQFRNKPVELTAAILAGMEVGLSPMAAMRSFDIIQNQAAPRAITLRAIVQSFGHELVLEESTATRCRMKGRRRGTDEWQRVTWTMDRARDLGLTSKDNWKKQPGAMLVARATSELARLIASDAILGIGYSAEEIADGGAFDLQVESDTTVEQPPSGGTRKMSRRKQATEDGQPVRDEEGQVRAMWAAFAEASGFEHDPNSEQGRDERLQFIGQVVGREVESSKDLTWDERSLVIDALKDPLADVQPPAPAEDGEQ